MDDEPFNVLGLQMMIDQIGFKDLQDHIYRAYNGMQAITVVQDCLTKKAQSFGIILMDISMPLLDGFKASLIIRQLHKQLGIQEPLIIACTGHTEEEFVKKAWRHGIDELLAKPIDSEILSQIFDEFLIFE